eukprot:164239-Prymnesium_polylepis.1
MSRCVLALHGWVAKDGNYSENIGGECGGSLWLRLVLHGLVGMKLSRQPTPHGSTLKTSWPQGGGSSHYFKHDLQPWGRVAVPHGPPWEGGFPPGLGRACVACACVRLQS